MSYGHNKVLQCNFTGRPAVNITWNHPPEVIGMKTSANYGNSRLIETIGSFNITFVPKICFSYKITCTGKHQFGTAEQSTNLSVIGR